MLDCIIADDSHIMRKIIRANLEKLGIKRVSETTNGDETISKFSTVGEIDLLFLDINMPVKNGIEVYETLREKHLLGNTKVVIISAELFDDNLEFFKDNGIECFIPKPFDINAFNEIVKPLIEKLCVHQSNKKANDIEEKKELIAKTFATKNFKATATNKVIHLQSDSDSISIDLDRSIKSGALSVDIKVDDKDLRPLEE